MAIIGYSSVVYRELQIEDVYVGDAVMADIGAIDVSDLTDGIDTAEFVVNNAYHRYFDGHQFKRGMTVQIIAGMAEGQIETLFRGTMERPRARGDKRSQTISIRCAGLPIINEGALSLSRESYRRVTVVDAITRLLGNAGLKPVWQASAPHVQRAQSIITSFFPLDSESDLQRAMRLTREYLGAQIKIANGSAVITDVPGVVSSSAPAWTLQWGRDIDRYDHQESSSERAARKQKSTATKPTIISEDAFEKGIAKLPESAKQAQRNARADAIRQRHNYQAGSSADTEAMGAAAAASAGESEWIMKIDVSNRDTIWADTRGTITGLGPYDGSYYVKQVDRQIGKDGYKQTLRLVDWRAA